MLLKPFAIALRCIQKYTHCDDPFPAIRLSSTYPRSNVFILRFQEMMSHALCVLRVYRIITRVRMHACPALLPCTHRLGTTNLTVFSTAVTRASHSERHIRAPFGQLLGHGPPRTLACCSLGLPTINHGTELCSRSSDSCQNQVIGRLSSRL